MAKYLLYLLLAVFILINGLNYFKSEISHTLKLERLVKYKIKKRELYESKGKEILSLLKNNEKILNKNKELFFSKKQKETIVYSKIQALLQKVVKKSFAKILKSNTGIVIDKKNYKKYTISLRVEVVPEYLDKFFKELYKQKYYFSVDSIYISRFTKNQTLLLQLVLVGYQLK